MTDPTPIPADDDDLEVDAKRVDDEVAPEGPHLGERVKVFRSLDGKPQSAEFVRYEEDGALLLRILDRMGRSKEPAEGSVPEKGERIAWTLFEHDQRVGPQLPEAEETPWTHGGPPRADVVELPDAVTPEDVL